MLLFEGGSSGSHYMESSLWKRLWTCLKTDFLNERYVKQNSVFITSFDSIYKFDKSS